MAALVEVVGAKELRATMKQASVDLGELKDVHRQVASIVKGAVRAPMVTGALASSVRAGATLRASVVRAGGARVPYAGVIEWGWPRRNIAPAHYLTNAGSSTEPAWTAAYEQGVQDILDKVRGA